MALLNRLNEMAETPEQKMALDGLILLERSGSHLYGTNTPESDDDYVGVFIQSRDYVVGRKVCEVVEFNTNPSNSGKKNGPEDLDCKLYSLDKFIGLAVGNNPNCLEFFFPPENCVIFENGFGKQLRNSFNLFVSLKAYHSFRGYAHSQKERLEIKSGNQTGRRELQALYGYDVKLASHNLRLLLECFQLLKEGVLAFPLAENKLLLDVKRGKFNLEQFYEESKRLSAMVDLVYTGSKLPHGADLEAINDLQIELYENYWSSK